jgi:hypothetical protein
MPARQAGRRHAAAAVKATGLPLKHLPVGDLLLDSDNPRFASLPGIDGSQRAILDRIADEIDVSDLLSSMSMGGYYSSSPMIVVPAPHGKHVVVEGNRRLAAVLILLRDERATGQAKRADAFPTSPALLDTMRHLPCIVSPTREIVLPHLGIAHILGNRRWDSYAKAAWAVRVIDKRLFKGGIREISDRIGDRNETLLRMIEGYRITAQLEAEKRFDPRDSAVKGRATAPFPFSWTYTALSFPSIRRYVGLAPDKSPQERAGEAVPIAEDHLDEAADLFLWMFGSKTRKIEPVVGESRDISDLALACENSRARALIKAGKPLSVAIAETKSPVDQLQRAVVDADDAITALLKALTTHFRDLSESDRDDVVRGVRGVHRLSKQAVSVAQGDDGAGR